MTVIFAKLAAFPLL